ncbi:hypothetical protein XENORESO_014701 [Xenotaenia resolanae]|uniref:Uncharacterized protein n=1 Tax=Xenotaenia resolanae TaxID=208358 RepID=A0ABV0WMI6_9TELE
MLCIPVTYLATGMGIFFPHLIELLMVKVRVGVDIDEGQEEGKCGILSFQYSSISQLQVFLTSSSEKNIPKGRFSSVRNTLLMLLSYLDVSAPFSALKSNIFILQNTKLQL